MFQFVNCRDLLLLADFVKDKRMLSVSLSSEFKTYVVESLGRSV